MSKPAQTQSKQKFGVYMKKYWQLYAMLFEFSRSYQTQLIGYENSITNRIQNALKTTPALFPD